MFGSVRRYGGTIVVAAIVGAVAAGGPAVAAEVVGFAKSAGDAKTVNKIGASKTPRAGKLLPLNAKGKFPAAVIPASRQAVGMAGPAGAQGLQGAQGPAGADGASGPQGAKGDTGANGATGPAGADGADGATGPAGPAGPIGPQGLAGEVGAIGPQGPAGADGATGAAGPEGPVGPQGPAGADGATGPQGPAGADGATGAAGPQGPKGDKGDQGDQGPAGGLVYPSLVDVNPLPRASASNNWDSVLVNGASWNNAYRASFPGGDATSFLEWELPLAAGTWDLEVTYVKDVNAGILTFSLDDETPIGAFDSHSNITEHNERGLITGINVATSGMHTLRVRTATKNPDSTQYFGYLVWLRLVKQ